MQLNRELIVDAGLSILNTYGLGDMTMRRIATHLSVAPGALYWHFANKQSLIEAIAERILAPLLAPGTQPPAGPEDAADRFRSAVLAVRDGAEVVSVGLAMPDLGRTVVDFFAAALASTTSGDVRVGAVTLTHFTMGSVTAEQAAEQLGTEPREGRAADFAAGVRIILAGLACA